MTDRHAIIEKLLKIKKLAEDEATSEQAAANYAGKMAKIMQEHAIAEHELETATELERPGVDFENKYFDNWRMMILTACCLHCGTHSVMYRKARPSFLRIYGRPLAVEATWEMYKFLEQQIVKISRTMYSSTKESRQAQKGLGIGVCEKMDLQYDEFTAQGGDSRALMVIDQERALSEESMREELGDPKPAKRRPPKVTEAVYQGYRRADEVEINRKVSDA